MSRRDDLHFPVRRALEKEGWTITHDPIVIAFRDIRLKVDLGAERYFAAEKEGRKIAVEVKDFDRKSLSSELQKLIGQLRFISGRSKNILRNMICFLPSARRCMMNTYKTSRRHLMPLSRANALTSSFAMSRRR